MFNIVKEGSIAGNVINEDKIYTEDNFVVFLDGASGLTKKIIPNSESDANWYVNEFVTQFKNEVKKSNYKYKRYILKNTISNIKDNYNSLLNNRKIDNINIPSASGIVLFNEENHIKAFYFGDVLTVIKKKNNTFLELYDKNLTELDNKVFKEANKISARDHIPFNLAIKKCDKAIIKNRNLRNTDNGYYIFGLNIEAIKNIKTFRIEKNDIKEILIMSDGFYSYFIDRDFNTIIEKIKLNKPEELLSEIKNSFEKDNNFSKYNRFKLVDDISYLYIKP